MIFGEPILASVEYEVGGQTLTLYELSADLYYDHVLNPQAMERWHTLSQTEKTEGEEPDYEQVIASRKADKDSQLDWVACSLLPGCPDESFESIRAELKASLNIKNLADMYQKAFALGAGDIAKKSDSPDDSLSTD